MRAGGAVDPMSQQERGQRCAEAEGPDEEHAAIDTQYLPLAGASRPDLSR
jgi:hypothetical protein